MVKSITEQKHYESNIQKKIKDSWIKQKRPYYASHFRGGT